MSSGRDEYLSRIGNGKPVAGELSVEQVLELWRQSGGHVLRFTRLVESFHGVIHKEKHTWAASK